MTLTHFFLKFVIDPGAHGGDPGGSRTHPRGETHQAF